MSAPSFLDCRLGSAQAPGTEPEDAALVQTRVLEQLRRWEAGAVLQRRTVAGVSDQPPPPADGEAAPPDDLVGLALSGGGVRSAAFNLGFLQSLSQAGLMRYVDYLCSVSGGGYIAGHFTALANLIRPEEAPSFHDSAAARLGLADRQRLEAGAYRFRHMGDYLTDYVGFAWRYVIFTLPLLFWAACLLGIPAALAALVWRLCDLPLARQYFDLVGLGQLGTALHLGDETPMAFLPSVLCFFALMLLVLLRWVWPASKALHAAVRGATVGWIASLGISIAVFLGNGETSLGASAELQKIQSNVTWPLMLLTLITFLPLLAGRKLMQSGREHAPRWKKLVFHGVIGGATVSAVFLMVHLMARENISGFATHRDSRLLPDDIYDWNALLALVHSQGPLAAWPVEVSADGVTAAEAARKLQAADVALRNEREQLIGRTTWEQWEGLPLVHLFGGTRRLWNVHFQPNENAWTHLRKWLALRDQQTIFLDTYLNPLLFQSAGSDAAASLTARLLDLAVLRADDAADKPAIPDAGKLLNGVAAQPPRSADLFQIDERRKLETFLDTRAKGMREGATFADLAQRYLLHMTQAGDEPGAALQSYALTPAERAQFNRLLLECLFPKIIRERTMVSTTIVPGNDQWYRCFWLAFWMAGFFAVGLVNINRLSPFYDYYRDRLDEYFVQSAPQAAAASMRGPAVPQPASWDALRNLRPWEQGAPYPLMLGSAFFLSKVGVVPPPGSGSAAADAFKQHSFLFSPLYCGTAATGYQRTDTYCGGDLKLSEAMAMSGAALTPFMIDNVWFAGLMAAFNFRIGQWLPRPAHCGDAVSPRCLARPLSLLKELWRSLDLQRYSDTWQMALVADGGFHDFFGLEELLLRRCKLIIVSDAGCNNDQYEFGALADVIRLARERHGIDLVDLDDDQAADLCGLRRIASENRQQLYHTCLRILYPPRQGETLPEEGLLVYAQMSLTGREQIDLQQFRKTHPNFPDEPITNQFFSHGQIESYRQLGYHIGSVVCRHIHAEPDVTGARPAPGAIADDLVRGYLHEYYAYVHCGELASADFAIPPAERSQEAICLQQAWRSSWFCKAGAGAGSATVSSSSAAVFRYEREAVFRREAMERVQSLLSRPEEPPISASEMDTGTAIGMLLACHERNAGARGARFLPGGRQVLIRGLPVLLKSLPMPQVSELPSDFIDAAHRPSPAPLLLDLATAVFERGGASAVADFVICAMRWHGLRYFNRWGFHRELTDYKDELLTALAARDLAQLAELTANWKLPPRMPAAVTATT